MFLGEPPSSRSGHRTLCFDGRLSHALHGSQSIFLCVHAFRPHAAAGCRLTHACSFEGSLVKSPGAQESLTPVLSSWDSGGSSRCLLGKCRVSEPRLCPGLDGCPPRRVWALSNCPRPWFLELCPGGGKNPRLPAGLR